MTIAKKIIYYFLYILAILFFATICVSIIFYASGYRLNAKAKKIQKTGILILDYRENNIKVFVDGKEIKTKKNLVPNIISSPYSVTLLPGEYSLEIKKEGKKNFQKKIKIDPELITKIENVLLFPEQNKEETIIEGKIKNYSLSPDNKKIIYTDEKNQVQLYDIEKKETKILSNTFSENQTISSYAWSIDSKKIVLTIIQNKNIFNYIIEIDNPEKSYFLHEKFSFVPFFEKILFSNKNPNELFALVDGKIYGINTASLTMNVLEKNASNLVKSNDYLYYYQKDEKQIIQFDTNIYKKTIIAKDVMNSDDFSIFSLNKDRDIYLKNFGKIYYIQDQQTQKIIDEDTDSFFTSLDDKNFYYAKKYELWFYDKAKKEKTLITRLSKTINKLEEYEDKYLLYSTDDSVEIIRTDNTNNIMVKENIKINLLKIIGKNKILLGEEKEEEKKFTILDL